MADEQKMRPGANPHTGEPQGSLKEGNTVGVGRKPNEKIRLIMADGIAIGLKRVKGILEDKKCVPHITCGKKVLQHPTQEDFKWAMEYCAKYGLGLPKQELDVDLNGTMRTIVTVRLPIEPIELIEPIEEPVKAHESNNSRHSD